MELREIIDVLEATLECCEDRVSTEIEHVCASDLMSDVLAFSDSGTLLLTGLVNSQSIMTAHVADVAAVAYVRGKRPTDDVIRTAADMGIPVITCRHSMFEACGRLHRRGLLPGSSTGERA